MDRANSSGPAKSPRVVGPRDGRLLDLGSLGVRYLIHGDESAGAFALVEHPIPPRTLAAPLHRHSREDEFSFVLEGRLGAMLGDDVVYAGIGDLVFKPRDQWHTFWNAGDTVCRILEIISPGGFERYFSEVAQGTPRDDVAPRYGLEVDVERVPDLCRENGLRFRESS